MMRELMRAPLYSYDLKRKVSPKTSPTSPLTKRYAAWVAETFTGMPNAKTISSRIVAAAISRVTLTYTEPTRPAADANAMELPVQQNAVARALSSPMKGIHDHSGTVEATHKLH